MIIKYKKKTPIILLKGFTLIELLMTMGVIAVLASVMFIIINPTEQARRARDSKRISDLSTIKTAIDLGLADGEELISTAGWVTFGADVDNFAGMTDFKIGKYAPTIPKDPYKGTGLPKIITDGAACSTSGAASIPEYLFWSDGETYIVRSVMESKTNCNLVQDDGNPNSTYELGTEPGLDTL